MKISAKQIAYVALGVAVIAVCSWISIPLTIPFTLQTFAVCLITALYGRKWGVTTVIIYILLGAFGLPVFAGFKGGFAALLGTTGGYIIGFIFTALIVGTFTKHLGRSVPVLLISMAIGILVCYAFGTAWFVLIYTRTKGTVGIMTVLGWCVFPYIIPDAVKAAIAALLVKRLEKSVNM